jgi:prophage tail gpP-like protein
VLDQWQYLNIGALEFCKLLGAQFGIVFELQDGLQDAAISTTGPTGKAPAGGHPNAVGSAGKSSSLKIGKPLASIPLNPGDGAFDVVNAVCRAVGVLPVSNGLGKVVLTLAGGLKTTTSLVEGVNILSSSVTYDAASRYRKYIVSGQGPGSETIYGDALSVTGTAEDQNVQRPQRTLFIRPGEALTSTAFANRRAGWEATVRAARAMRLAITVQGWTQQDGSMWPANALVPVYHPAVGIDADELLIAETAFAMGPGGSTTTLSLVRSNAFVPEAVLLKGPKSGDGAFRELMQ